MRIDQPTVAPGDATSTIRTISDRSMRGKRTSGRKNDENEVHKALRAPDFKAPEINGFTMSILIHTPSNCSDPHLL
jgi:hypothetical protein